MTSPDSPSSIVGTAPGLPKTARGERTRTRILKAAEETFGTLGYHRAGIADITRAAGVASGTFYTYFSSKEQTLRELVQEMGRRLRAHLERETADAGDRLEAEEKGLRAFLQYLRDNPALYRVLQEAQFVDESIYRRYYESFGERYVRMLARATDRGEIRSGNDEVRVWALMGISNFIGLRYALWETEMDFDDIVATVSDLLRNGLAAGGGREKS
ncbi:TetR/AcrR family transcriptional regulator [Microbulbifer flavimaris]|uniref:TetR/AcrR family transcriptional regulator n=1 Tax=Microbulbifer flavimaris TaxID=1781068 RepID=A0ABX4I228_9GAMM|nr:MULTISPECIES: TetR/AcrR family transcriptional regulator [Microbulbifer]KUJ83775.1 TetR family transcriptional regulator [Microbulbifer sp. ZGT114]PCO05950.1 TetR/AcrR family transcriptional regulator [Microbulbifer flavimaris]